eukprot:8069230-Lingulodinium_polyedra.AAC.1
MDGVVYVDQQAVGCWIARRRAIDSHIIRPSFSVALAKAAWRYTAFRRQARYVAARVASLCRIRPGRCR